MKDNDIKNSKVNANGEIIGNKLVEFWINENGKRNLVEIVFGELSWLVLKNGVVQHDYIDNFKIYKYEEME